MYANVDADDAHHQASRAFLETHPGPIFVPTMVVAEVAYFARTRLGTEAEVRFLEDIATGVLDVMPVEHDDWDRIIELTIRYRDLPLGTVDASVVALAERLRVAQIATFDVRDFGAVRPKHVDAFELLP